MTLKKFTFEDWLNVTVVLKSTNGVPNEVSKRIIVSFDNFDSEEARKIQETQRVVFNDFLKKKFAELKNEFFSKIENSNKPNQLTKNEYDSLHSLILNKFTCKNNFCTSPIKGDDKKFSQWYYNTMMSHLNDSKTKSGGIVLNYNEIPSPNSRIYENGLVPPEVMISAFLKMFNLVSKLNPNKQFRNRTSNEPKNTSSTINELNQSILSIEENERVNPFPDIFSSFESYDFFCELERVVVNSTEPVAGYSFIFHKMKDEKLKYPIKKNVSQSDFCEFLKEKRGQEEIYPPKLPKRNPIRKQEIYQKYLENYLMSVQGRV